MTQTLPAQHQATERRHWQLAGEHSCHLAAKGSDVFPQELVETQQSRQESEGWTFICQSDTKTSSNGSRSMSVFVVKCPALWVIGVMLCFLFFILHFPRTQQ